MQAGQTLLTEALRAARAKGLGAAEALLPAYGIEYVSCGGRELAYINLGETYATTVCAEGADYWLGSWGAWYEEVEAEHCKEQGVIRCAYCGAFADLPDGADWREVECEHCGHLVGG